MGLPIVAVQWRVPAVHGKDVAGPVARAGLVRCGAGPAGRHPLSGWLNTQ